MANRLPTVWDADPHTIAKIAILKNYLNAWFPIVASRFSGALVYIDGFAGPGSYRNHPEGSPLAALSIFRTWLAKSAEKIRVREVIAIFIEADQQRFAVLKEKTSEYAEIPLLNVITKEGEFSVTMEALLKDARLASTFSGGQPLLVFADPFGGTGIPFRLFERCLGSSGSELLLNFDADGIARIHAGKNERWQQQLDELYGSREWETEFEASGTSLVRRAEIALALYKKRLLEIRGVDYVWAFEMRGKHDRINYYLVFATRNRLGMEKMKEAMRQLDVSGGFCFSDAYADQHVLFRDDDVSTFAERMHCKFKMRSASYEELDRFALCETPFTNPKKMLECLSRAGRIAVSYVAGSKVRAHAFPEDAVESVAFIDAAPIPVQGELL
jgi:three-Cys-motif partner protein